MNNETVTILLQLVGAVGIGAIATKILDVVWLQRVTQQNEETRWFRDRRYEAYCALSKELISHGLFNGTTTDLVADGLAADAILLTDNVTISRGIEDYFRHARAARDSISEYGSGLQSGDPNAKQEEYQELRRTEFARLDAEGRTVVGQLAQDLRRGRSDVGR